MKRVFEESTQHSKQHNASHSLMSHYYRFGESIVLSATFKLGDKQTNITTKLTDSSQVFIFFPEVAAVVEPEIDVAVRMLMSARGRRQPVEGRQK